MYVKEDLRPDLDHDKKESHYLRQGKAFLGQVLNSRKRDSTDFQTSVIRRRRRVITSVWHLWRASLITLIDGLPCTNSFIQLFLITAITIIKAGSIMTGNHCIGEGDDNQSLIIRLIYAGFDHTEPKNVDKYHTRLNVLFLRHKNI